MPVEGGPGLPGHGGPGPNWPGPPLPAVVLLDGRRLTLRPAPGAPLLRALRRKDWMAFVPGLLGRKDRAWLYARLYDPQDPLDLTELAAVAQWCAGYVCQMPWWAGHRLAAAAHHGWGWLDGMAALHGVDLEQLPVDRMLAVVWSHLRDRVNSEDSLESLTETVFESGMDELQLANRVAPESLSALEMAWAAEAAASMAGMDGVWDPTAPV